jgi:hypothetical protein
MGAKILVVEPGGSFFYKFFGFNTPARHAEGTANPFIPWTEEQWYSSSAKKCKTTPHPPPPNRLHPTQLRNDGLIRNNTYTGAKKRQQFTK